MIAKESWRDHFSSRDAGLGEDKARIGGTKKIGCH